ncbi:MAG: hypothetical protein H6617_03600 [Bdellovibrionaceae bacterium]|nr:hypothetical protein [Bdellovibrionales bacterium]MCB9253744.1 hypothetical protein [Pseudobdellovibrionaceae bacterium]
MLFRLAILSVLVTGVSLQANEEIHSDSLPNRGSVVSVRRDVRPWNLDLFNPCKSNLTTWKHNSAEPIVFAYCRVNDIIPKKIASQGLAFHSEGSKISQTVNVGKHKVIVQSFMESAQNLRIDAWIYGVVYSAFSGKAEEQTIAKQVFATAAQSAIAKWKGDNTILHHYTLFYNTRDDFNFDGKTVGSESEARLFSTFETKP